MTPALLGAALVAGVACSHHDQNVTTGPVAYCSAVRPIAVVVTVRDSLSGRALADSATGTLQLAGAAEPMVHADSLTLFGGEQLGVYDVSVERPGYREWTRAAVAVTKIGACGSPVPVTISASLQAQ